MQGYLIESREHWTGVSLEKRRALFQAALHLLSQPQVARHELERLVGKMLFVVSAAPHLASVLEQTHCHVQQERDRRRRVALLPPAVAQELLLLAVLLPLAQFNTAAPWAERVECSDACLSGLGRAFASWPREVVAAVARSCDGKGVYTSLGLPWGLDLDEAGRCPLKRVEWPTSRCHWHHLSSRASGRHITLEEAAACNWAAEDRLRRPSETGLRGSRGLHGVDSAALCGAFVKGRSASRRLNVHCRRQAAIAAAGDLCLWYPWIESEQNPADAPSRVFEPPKQKAQRLHAPCPEPQQPQAAQEVPLPNLPWGWSAERYFLHLCSGPRNDGDFTGAFHAEMSSQGLAVRCVGIDPLNGHHGDLLDPAVLSNLEGAIAAGHVVGGLASPPCSTVSAVRHVPLPGGGGPRPLRARSAPFECLPNRTARERSACELGTLLYLLCLDLLSKIRERGGYISLEHPADRGCEPFHRFGTLPF